VAAADTLEKAAPRGVSGMGRTVSGSFFPSPTGKTYLNTVSYSLSGNWGKFPGRLSSGRRRTDEICQGRNRGSGDAQARSKIVVE